MTQQKTLTTIFLVVLGLLVFATLYIWRTEVNWVPADETNTWDTASSSIAEFRYPDDLDTNYVLPVKWPPRVLVTDAPYVCEKEGPNVPAGAVVEERKIVGTLFCVMTITEDVAGGVHTDYAYMYEDEGKTLTLAFSTQTLQCNNYSGSRQERCLEEQALFDMDSFVVLIKKTLFIR